MTRASRLVAAGAALGLHALVAASLMDLLAASGSGGTAGTHRAHPASRAAQPATQARLLQVRLPSPRPKSAQAPLVPDADGEMATGLPLPRAEGVMHTEPHLPAEPTTEPSSDHALATHQVAGTDAADTAPRAYLPRRALSKAPQAQGPIDIPFPPGVPEGEVHRARLQLYIDELGVVRKVEVAQGTLPPPLEEAARLSFMQASFQPGELAGRPARALIVVEVEFDNSQPSPHAQAPQSAPPGTSPGTPLQVSAL